MDVGLVCDVCSSFSKMGAKNCVACGAVLSLDPAPTQQQVSAARGDRSCPQCGALVAAGHQFCGSCGNSMPKGNGFDTPEDTEMRKPLTRPAAPRASGRGGKAKTMFFGAMQATRAKLVLIKGDGLDGISYTLAGKEHEAGRLDGDIRFEEDPFLSPRHANFFYRDNKLVVRDESSENGVFIRIRGSHPIQFGDRFLVGEQVLGVEQTPTANDPLEAEEDGTYYYSSKRTMGNFRLVQVLRGGDSGLAYQAPSDVISIGREDNDVNFSEDPFISGHHAQVSCAEGRLNLTDLGSKNGTFLKVNLETVLQHGDYVFMGQQLLRVEIV